MNCKGMKYTKQKSQQKEISDAYQISNQLNNKSLRIEQIKTSNKTMDSCDYSLIPKHQLTEKTYINFCPQTLNLVNVQNSQLQIQCILTNMCMVLNNHSQLLNQLIQKNNMCQETNSKIYEQIKKNKKEEVQIDKKIGAKHCKQKNLDITAKSLISILYGQKTTFKMKLVVDNKVPFETTQYRSKNFSLKINLIDQKGKLFQNSNKIPISLAVCTVQNPPKFLQSNTLGNKILKGYTYQNLLRGTCLFEKIQISQVTSHYRKGMLFLVAFPKIPSSDFIQDKNFIDYQQIRPLVIDKIVVKAKKMKQKQSLTENNSQFAILKAEEIVKSQ